MELNIFNTLKEAWETSTISNNRFNSALCRVCKWNDQFYADGEYYFVKGGFCFTTPVLDPFDACDWKPSASFSDGSMISF